jgi:PAS domain S-box-containing protein
MKTLTKLILANALIAILIISIFAALALNRFHAEAVKEVNADLERCLQTAWALLGQKGKDFRVSDGKLLVGSYVVNGNFEVPDKVQEIFGGVATVFMGDTRVSTNVLQADGSRAVGTRLEGPAYDAIFKERKSYRGETRILGIPYLTAYDPIRNGQGEIIGTLFVGVKKADFLARFTGVRTELTLLLLGLVAGFAIFMALLGRMTKKYEKTKEAQQEFAESLVQNSAVPTFVLDSRHRVIIWNKACEELTGMKATEMIGSDDQWRPFYPEKRPVLADIVLDDNRGALPTLYDKYIRSPLTPDGLQGEGWYAAMNGKDRFIFFDATPVRDSAGKITAAIETLQDITERKEAEESLRLLSQAIEQTPTAVVITDCEGTIEYVNPYFSKVTGYAAEEAIGQNPRILKSGWHPPEFYSELWKTILAGSIWRGEFRNKGKNGELYWENMSISPVKNAAGRITHFVAVKENITERKWAEEELHRWNRELESKVEERTRQLLASQEELVRQEKLAILGQLSGSVGHELRNPLGVMSNAVYFLKMVLADADATVQEYLEIIKKEIDNSLQIITDLLDFARTRPPRTTVVTARELTAESLGRCAIPENVELQNEIPDNLPLLRVDPLQMGQVLTNFITNAVQAMPDGGILHIAARLVSAGEQEGQPQELPRQDFIAISVTDSGEGISAENMKKLFQPLFTTKAKGIGLGLVVCKNLVAANGGRIEVESEPAKGTTFTVVLPIERGKI